MSTKKDAAPIGAEERGVDRSRRNFLSAGVAGAAAATVGTGAAIVPAAATESDAEKKKARYQETDHVKKFYATNRY